MKDEIISFETAKLAKEKGFVNNDKGYYVPMYDGDGNQIKEKLGYQNDWLIVAPTQSLLQKWLREVHKLNIWVTDWEMSLWYFNIKDGRESPTRTIRILAKNFKDFEFQTYEEALEKALEEALKFIET